MLYTKYSANPKTKLNLYFFEFADVEVLEAVENAMLDMLLKPDLAMRTSCLTLLNDSVPT